MAQSKTGCSTTILLILFIARPARNTIKHGLTAQVRLFRRLFSRLYSICITRRVGIVYNWVISCPQHRVERENLATNLTASPPVGLSVNSFCATHQESYLVDTEQAA
jgi:hypothetical protein